MSNFVHLATGTCSFCGRTDTRCRITRDGRDVVICEECLGMCCDIVMEAEISSGALTETRVRELGVYVDQLRVPILASRDPATGMARELRNREIGDFACSFCDHASGEVARLISGPSVFICESCTLHAARTAARQLTAPA